MIRKGKQVKSASLEASGKDAFFDAILSASVLFSAVIQMIWNVSLEAYVGAVISVFIIKSGFGMLVETLDDILGKRVDRELLAEIKKTICEDGCVSGAFDLILHSYGPETYIGSVHVEVRDTMTAEEIDVMERRIAQNVFLKHGVFLGGIGIYSMNTQNDDIKELRSKITHLVMGHDGVLQIHGFYADIDKKTLSFDVILDYALEDRTRTYDEIRTEIAHEFPDYDRGSLENLIVCCGFTGYAETCTQLIFNCGTDFIAGDTAVVHKKCITP